MTTIQTAEANWLADASRFAVISRLADDLGHELKNPLHSMVINLEVLRRRAEKGDNAAVQERVVVLEHEIHRLNQLMDGLLKLLRPGRDKGAPASLREIIDGIWPLVELRARLARVELEATPAPEHTLTRVPSSALRLAILGLSETAVERARLEGVPLRATWQNDRNDELFRFSVASGNPASALANSADGDDGARHALILLADTGATIETDDSGLLVRIPAATTLT